MTDPRWISVLRPLRGWSRKRIEEHQLGCVKALLRQVARSLPFYRQRLREAGIDPEGLISLEELERLPMTEKRDIQEAWRDPSHAALVDRQRLVCHVSSGTTGEPLRVLRTRFEERLLQAFRLRVMVHLGLRPSDRRVDVVWDGPDRASRALHERFGPFRRRTVSCRLPADAIMAVLERERPEALGSLPGVLAWLIDEIGEASRDAVRPRTVWIGGEASSPALRRRFADWFEATVHETYGSNEFNLLAWECPQGYGYHVADPTVLLEVRRENRPALPGEDGEVIATALCSRTMPFIRYRIGDIARRGPTPCPCGAPWSTIQRLQGRVVERFVRADGSSFHPWGLGDAVMESAPWVQRFRFEQESTTSIRLLARPLAGHIPTPVDRRTVLRSAQLAVGDGLQIHLRVVDDLPSATGGKSQPYVCRVAKPRLAP